MEMRKFQIFQPVKPVNPLPQLKKTPVKSKIEKSKVDVERLSPRSAKLLLRQYGIPQFKVSVHILVSKLCWIFFSTQCAKRDFARSKISTFTLYVAENIVGNLI